MQIRGILKQSIYDVITFSFNGDGHKIFGSRVREYVSLIAYGLSRGRIDLYPCNLLILSNIPEYGKMSMICPRMSKVTDAEVVAERNKGQGPKVITIVSHEHRDKNLIPDGGCQDHVLLSICIVKVPRAICREG